MRTAQGDTLLVDGWWGYSRKIQVSTDDVGALSWGIVCGFDHYQPCFYVTFCVGMFAHRAHRDIQRCRSKPLIS